VWVVTDRRGRVARVLEGPADSGASFGPAEAGSPFAFGRRSGAAGEIWLTPGGGAPAVRLLGGDGRLYQSPAFSPDGASLAYSSGGDGSGRAHLHLLEISTGLRRALTADPGRADTHPAFSPDGGVLFFEGSSAEDTAVYALDLARNELQRVTAEGAPSRRPAPLTRELVVVERHLAGRVSLMLVDRVHGRERPLSDDAARDPQAPSVHASRRGKLRLAYAALVEGVDRVRRAEVFVARVRGVSLAPDAPLTEDASTEELPGAEPAAPAGTG
jgi:dipeptidyl aminopeptidase/acylaminoacyl peptidase